MKKTYAFLIICLIISFFIDSYVPNISLPFLDIIMEWFSHILTVFFILLILSGVFLYEEKKQRFILILFISFFSAICASYILKLIIMRPRPEGLRFLTFALGSLKFSLPDYSFPSSHAASAFSVLPILDKEFSRIKLFWLFFSFMVAFSRIYLNMHYLSDVIAGTILGLVFGEIIIKLDDKYEISKKIFSGI